MQGNPAQENNIVAPRKKRQKWKRWLIGSLLFLVLFLGLGMLWVRFYLDPYLKNWLETQVQKGSKGKYSLHIQDLHTSLWYLTIQVKGLRLRSTKPREEEGLNLDLKAKYVSIKHIDWWLYWNTQKITVESIELNAPEIEIYNPKARNSLKINDVPNELQKFVASFTPELRIKNISLLRAKCGLYANSPAGKVFHQFSRMDLTMQELRFEAGKEKKTSLGDFALQVRDYQFITPDKYYMLRCQSLQTSMRERNLTVRNVRFAPLQQDQTRDRVTLQLPYLQIQNLDFQELLKLNIHAGKFEAKQANLLIDTKISHTHAVEKANAPIPFPQDLSKRLQNFFLPIAIDTFQISKAHFLFRLHTETHEGFHEAKEASLTLLQLRLGQSQNVARVGESDFDVESGEPLFFKGFKIVVNNFQHEPTSGLYKFGVQHLLLSSQDSVLRLEKAYLKPRLSPQATAAQLAYQSIISSAELPLLTARKVNFEKMIYQQKFHLGSLHLHQLVYEAFLDATKPKQTGQQFRNFEQMLRTIPLDIQADTLAVHSAKVTYKSLQKARNRQSNQTTDSIPRIATHELEKLDFTVLKIDLGRAFQESVIEHIDAKRLNLHAEGYTYQNAEGTYALQAKRVEAIAHKRLISVSELSLLPTEQNGQASKVSLHLPQMRGEGVDFVSFMLKQQMDWNKLTVEGAKVQISTTQQKRKKDRFLKKFELENALQTMPIFVRVDTLQLKGATFTLEEADKQGAVQARHQVEQVDMELLDIGLGKGAYYALDSLPVFWNETSLTFALKRYSYEAQGLTYRFALENIQKRAFSHHWEIEALAWKSNLDITQYRTKFPERKWLAEGSLRSISLQIPDLKEVIFHRHLAIQRADIQEPKLKFWVFEATKIPTKTDDEEEWWADLQQDVPLQFSMDTLLMQNAQITCEEAQKHWKQSTTLDLGIANLEWNNRLSWRNIALTGKDYVFQHTHSKLRVAQWQLVVEPAPIFKAKGTRFEWDSPAGLPTSWIEAQTALANFPMIELGKPLKLNNLQVSNGQGELFFASGNKPKEAHNQAETIGKHPFMLLADTVKAQNMAIKIQHKTANQTYPHSFVLEEGNLQELRWKLQSQQAPEVERFSVKVRDYEMLFKNALYRLSAQRIAFQNTPNTLTINHLKLLPTVTASTLNRQYTLQKELLEMEIKEVQVREIDMLTLLQKREIHAQRLVLDSAILHLSADRRLPTLSRKRRMPAEQLQGLKIPLTLDTLDTKKLSLFYKEKVKGVQNEGELFVQDIDAQILGLKTRPTAKDSLRLWASGKLMGVGEASLQASLSLEKELGANVHGKLGKLKANFMNEFLEATRHIQIRKGDIQGATFWLNMKDSLAIGELEAGYTHLRLDILSTKKENKKRGFISFLANVFIKNRNNTNKKRHKIGNILYPHLPDETFVRYLVKALASGILKTLM